MSHSHTDRVEKSIRLNAPRERVWRAISDYREFGAWFRVDLESPFVSGADTRGKITYPGYEHLTMQVQVVEVEPQRLLRFRWHPYAVNPSVDYSKEDPTTVSLWVEPDGNGTRLTITETGFDSIPAQRREEAFRMNSGGWETQLKNIEAHLTAKI